MAGGEGFQVLNGLELVMVLILVPMAPDEVGGQLGAGGVMEVP